MSNSDVILYRGDCLEVLPTLASDSIDAVICDPPYPCIKRDYGFWSESEWFDLMRLVVGECRRILKPSGSAVFILQNNQEHVGKTRTWLWDFMSWASHCWNVVQDFYWWNTAAIPTVQSKRQFGLARPSVKMCVWLGNPDCYRNQDAVLLPIAESVMIDKRTDRHELQKLPSGHNVRIAIMLATCNKRGGSTPVNLLVHANSDRAHSGGSFGHPAATPASLCDWWVRYITPPGGCVCDPFMGSGTVGIASVLRGRSFVGIERHGPYFEIAKLRLEEARIDADRPHRVKPPIGAGESDTPLFDGVID